jgi:hypothetical protein
MYKWQEYVSVQRFTVVLPRYNLHFFLCHSSLCPSPSVCVCVCVYVFLSFPLSHSPTFSLSLFLSAQSPSLHLCVFPFWFSSLCRQPFLSLCLSLVSLTLLLSPFFYLILYLSPSLLSSSTGYTSLLSSNPFAQSPLSLLSSLYLCLSVFTFVSYFTSLCVSLTLFKV